MEPIGALVVASAAGLLVLALAAAWTWWETRPHPAVPGPATDVLGDEPPAVVALLTDGWRMPVEAAPATLLDLAARGTVAIELRPGGRDDVFVRARRGALTSYEDHVLAHIERVAVGGVVPADALSTGPEEVSKGWWRRFRHAVIADAQARGLCVPRFPWGVVLPLWVGFAVVAFIWLVAVRGDLDNADRSVGASLMMYALIGAALFLAWISASDHQRDTPEGLAVAGRWLGVRAYLERNEVLRTVPPSAVAIWGRHLAYAAAMSLAGAAVEGLPLGAEDAREAWSPEGGRWRHVRVRYPRFRPGWGLHPGAAVAFGALWAVAGWMLFRFIGDRTTWWVGDALRFILGAIGAGGVAVVGVALADVASSPAQVEGTVLRMRDRTVFKLNPWRKREKRRYYLALDDGTRDTIAAWSVSPSVYAAVRQGQRARATVSHRLRHVTSIEPR